MSRSEPNTRIIGICLLRNEDHFIVWSLMNVAAFCDEIIVLDNNSSDRTPELLERVAERAKNLKVVRVDDAYDTHKYVENFAGENCWVFGIDGDEVYDPAALARLKARILDGQFDDCWRIYGHSMHVVDVDFAKGVASGFVQPAARTITKLYNFAAISSWRQGRHQRLHGKSMQFRPGHSLKQSSYIWRSAPWEASDLRCLHMCFSPRSSLESIVARPNPSEMMKSKKLLRRAADFIGLSRFSAAGKATYKQRFYAHGDIATGEIASFGRPADWLDLDARAGNVEALLRGNLNAAPG